MFKIAAGHRSVRYNPDLPFKVVPPSFKHGLVLLATLIRGGGGGSQAQDHGQASSTFVTGCLSQVLLQKAISTSQLLKTKTTAR